MSVAEQFSDTWYPTYRTRFPWVIFNHPFDYYYWFVQIGQCQPPSDSLHTHIRSQTSWWCPEIDIMLFSFMWSIPSFIHQTSINSFTINTDLKIWAAHLLFVNLTCRVSLVLELYKHQDKTKSIFVLFSQTNGYLPYRVKIHCWNIRRFSAMFPPPMGLVTWPKRPPKRKGNRNYVPIRQQHTF